MPSSITLKGSVLTRSGVPVAGMAVTITPNVPCFSGTPAAPVAVNTQTVATNQDGSWSAVVVPNDLIFPGSTFYTISSVKEKREIYVASTGSDTYYVQPIAVAGDLGYNDATLALLPTPRSIPVAAGGYVLAQNSVQASVGTARIPYYASIACTELQLLFTNWFVDGTFNDIDNSAAISFNASIEVGGTIYRVLFGGRTTATLDPGGHCLSDPVSIELNAGDLFYVRVFMNSTQWYPNRYVQYLGGGGFTITTDLTAPGSGAIADASALTKMYGPAAIFGVPRVKGAHPPGVLIVGDSIGYGQGDGMQPGVGINTNSPNAALNMGGGGFIVRALRGFTGILNTCVQGDTAKNFSQTLTGHARRLVHATRCTSAICAYGRNDVTNWTLAQTQSYLIASWRMLNFDRNLRTYQTTITPRTTSTDGWLTTANQTVHATEGVRVALNNWIRDGAPCDNTLTAVATGTQTPGTLRAGMQGHPLTGYFEISALVETAQDSGIWQAPPNQRVVTDAAITSGLFVLTSASANFNDTNDRGRTVVVTGAGAAGGLLLAIIKVVTNSTTVSISVAAGTTVAGASATICDGMTIDGIHPQPYAAQLMSVGVKPNVLI